MGARLAATGPAGTRLQGSGSRTLALQHRAFQQLLPPASAPLSGGMLGPGGPGEANFSFLSWSLLLLMLNLCGCARKSIQESLMWTLLARSVGLSQQAVLPRACRQLVPGGRLLLEATPPGSSSLWAHQAQGS